MIVVVPQAVLSQHQLMYGVRRREAARSGCLAARSLPGADLTEIPHRSRRGWRELGSGRERVGPPV